MRVMKKRLLQKRYWEPTVVALGREDVTVFGVLVGRPLRRSPKPQPRAAPILIRSTQRRPQTQMTENNNNTPIGKLRIQENAC
jgi:hypothetical protein